jgi:tRNA pseudouridine38-40 synthase
MTQYFYKAEIQYKGTCYNGWQIQKNQKGKTIQGCLSNALEQIVKSKNFSTIGSGRTDSGVHAKKQVCRINIPLKLNERDLMAGLNSLLPADIKINRIEISNEDFHPILKALKKEYLYYFLSQKEITPFNFEYVAKSPENLNFDLMSEACEVFIGEHDFSNFFNVGTEVPTNIRTIYEFAFFKANKHDFISSLAEANLFRVTGNGFLKQMVRIMVGTIWQVGLGKVSLTDFKKAVNEPTSGKIGPTAPASGLYLFNVDY